MSDGSKAEQLRDLLRLAGQLRRYISDTSDTHNIELFLEAADALEARAHRLAHGGDVPIAQHVDLWC